jgi:hypothetical protein
MRLRPGVVLAASAVAVALYAGEAPGPQTTVVKGAPPSLAGRWLAVANLKLDRRTRNTVAFWDVQGSGDRLVVTEHFLDLPPAGRTAIEQADAAGEPWTPSPELVAAFSEAWDGLPAHDVGLRSLEHEILAPEAFDAQLKDDPAAKDALWVVRQRFAFDPASTVVREERVWAGVVATRDGYRANVTAATVAGPPIPLALTFTGTGTLYRLADAPAPGILARIAATFRGCGRATSPPGSGRSAA